MNTRFLPKARKEEETIPCFIYGIISTWSGRPQARQAGAQVRVQLLEGGYPQKSQMPKAGGEPLQVSTQSSKNSALS